MHLTHSTHLSLLPYHLFHLAEHSFAKSSHWPTLENVRNQQNIIHINFKKITACVQSMYCFKCITKWPRSTLCQNLSRCQYKVLNAEIKTVNPLQAKFWPMKIECSLLVFAQPANAIWENRFAWKRVLSGKPVSFSIRGSNRYVVWCKAFVPAESWMKVGKKEFSCCCLQA